MNRVFSLLADYAGLEVLASIGKTRTHCMVLIGR